MSPAAFGMPLSQLGEINQLPELTLFSQVLVVCSATMRKACQLPNNQRRHCYCGNDAKSSAPSRYHLKIVTIALIGTQQ